MPERDPGGRPRGGGPREAARLAAVVAAALGGGAALLLLITQVVAPAPPRVAIRGGGGTAAVASPTTAPLPSLPEAPPAPAPPPPPTVDGGDAPDQYLGDLTTDRSTNTGEIDGRDYRFAHGYAMFLSRGTQEAFVVPSGYRSLTATLKGLGGTIQFTLTVGGQTILDRTLSPFQLPVTIVCATPEGRGVVLGGRFQGGGSLQDAVAVWGDARFSRTPPPSDGCS